MDIDWLLQLATQFRDAVERCDLTALPGRFETFPRGSCGDASLLLGAYLKDQGFGDFDHVRGEREKFGDQMPRAFESHAWLEKNGVIVDITADQFSDMSERVIVAKHSKWHAQWSVEQRDPGNYRAYMAPFPPEGIVNLARSYPLILMKIN